MRPLETHALAFNRLKDFRRIATRYDKLARIIAWSVTRSAAAALYSVSVIGLPSSDSPRRTPACARTERRNGLSVSAAVACIRGLKDPRQQAPRQRQRPNSKEEEARQVQSRRAGQTSPLYQGQDFDVRC
jgi:hypothetical protein